LRELLTSTPPSFAGYRGALLQALEGGGTDEEIKARVDSRIAGFARLTLTQRISLSGFRNSDFRALLQKHLASPPAAFVPFAQAMTEHLGRTKLEGRELKTEMMRFIAPMRPQHDRIYRTVKHEGVEHHHVAYMHYDRAAKVIYEVGFPYTDYRTQMHTISLASMAILGVVLIVVLALFPLFFRGSLLNPLNSLLRGVTKVNAGDLTVEVPIKVHDEIGFLAESFNAMVKSIHEAQEKLQDYANNLEEKVKERTRELNETLTQVHALKVQQDGDYFLTSLLQRPLNYNANKSKLVPTQFAIKQKKTFEFRNKHADLGGDICVTGNLRMGKPEAYRRYIFAMNGDAMGKSMQGAGGSLVMGVVMNTILARSAKNNRVVDTTPEQWLTDVYDEVHGVFGAFNGSMVISSVMTLIDEESGEMWYFNAEHPFMVIYRNGHASFIEEELQLRKLGLESEIPFRVHKFQLEPGDVVFMGSDGRDDVDLTPNAPQRTINEDEFMFLRHVEGGKGDIENVMQLVLSSGGMTDDLSLLRIGFQENVVARKLVREEEQQRVIIDIDWEAAPGEDSKLDEAFDDLFARGRKLARMGKHEEALDILRQAYSIRRDFPALNKILAVLTFKDRDYSHAIEILDTYLEHDPKVVDFWLYLSIAHKRLGENDQALQAALKVYELNPDRLPNLINLADLYQKSGDYQTARLYLDQALAIDPSNRQAQSLLAAFA
ncbi:MAG: SpoIIE family protein phosphatase, partial [Spirochaetia bacterium]|nr:SpoIIE family protein phosphatase [Spirochaetia bacterium]